MTTAQDPTLYVIHISCPSAGLAGYIAPHPNVPAAHQLFMLVADQRKAVKYVSESRAVETGHWWAARVVPKGAEFKVEVRKYEP